MAEGGGCRDCAFFGAEEGSGSCRQRVESFSLILQSEFLWLKCCDLMSHFGTIFYESRLGVVKLAPLACELNALNPTPLPGCFEQP